MYVSIAVVRAIVGELDRHGIAGVDVLESCGLAPRILTDAGAFITLADYQRLIEASLAKSVDPSFGLQAGWNAPTGAAHVLGFVLVNSATLRHAFRIFERYAPLIIETAEWSLTESPGEARFGFVHSRVEGEVARFEAELLLSYVLNRIGMHFLGPGATVSKACFVHPEPEWGEHYRQMYGCPVEFGAPRNELVFDPDCLDVTQLHSDNWVCELLKERAELLLRERRSDDRLKMRVKDVLKYHLPRGQGQAEDVARELGFTPRTLRRKLSQLGCSLRELSDEARKELAYEGMVCRKRSIKDVAYDLGFAEPSAFHRAFKRWTGLTPQQFRERQGDRDDRSKRAPRPLERSRRSSRPPRSP